MKQSRTKNILTQYVMPMVTLLGSTTIGNAASKAPCYKYQCFTQNSFTWNLVRADNPSQKPGLSGANVALKIQKGKSQCVNTGYVPAAMHATSTAIVTACSTTLNQGTAGFKTLSANHLNRLIRLTSAKAQQRSLIASEQPKLSSNRLANITVQLILSELNHVPGGFHLNPGDLIDVTLLTEEQRKVLMNHHGLMKEALRQLKAQLAVESAQVTA